MPETTPAELTALLGAPPQAVLAAIAIEARQATTEASGNRKAAESAAQEASGGRKAAESAAQEASAARKAAESAAADTKTILAKLEALSAPVTQVVQAETEERAARAAWWTSLREVSLTRAVALGALLLALPLGVAATIEAIRDPHQLFADVGSLIGHSLTTATGGATTPEMSTPGSAP